MIFNFITWSLDPEIFSIGPISIRYYGLLFALSFLLGYRIVEQMFKVEKIPMAWLEKFFMYAMIATVVGARLGHVFFYDWGYYSQNLGEIIMINKGGLASHGGAIGIVIAMIMYSKKVTKKSPLWIFDRMVVAVALAGCFIRIGNLFNSEIYGHETSLPWGFIFTINGETVPKHPTQLYEALAYLLLFFGLMYMYWKTNAKQKQGLIFGVFLVGVFLSRFIIEFVKESQKAFEDSMTLNMGQWLSIPFVLAGVYFIYRALSKNKAIANK